MKTIVYLPSEELVVLMTDVERLRRDVVLLHPTSALKDEKIRNLSGELHHLVE